MIAARIPVEVAPAPYEIVLGADLLAELPGLVEAACPATSYSVITDEHVGKLYGERVVSALSELAPCRLCPFPPGEWNKTRETWSALLDTMLAGGAGRDSAVIALGGGVSGDLAGFVAATFHRGIPYVQIPTSLLAMIDSSIGGKTGVDTRHGKNLVGAFHQPSLVVADVTVLRTLGRQQLAAGCAEALKHAAIADVGYLEWMTGACPDLFKVDADALLELVRRSIVIKSNVVAEDVHERGRRAILNFGHTVAHAIEATTRFEFLHGEAVAIGMVAEARLGVAAGVTAPGTESRLRDAIRTFDLPTTLPDIPFAMLREAMRRDKKNRSGTVRFSLLERLGSIARTETGNWTFPVDENVIESVLTSPS